MKNTKIIFYKLHPFNVLPAMVMGIFFKVIYWRSVALPKKILNRFEQIYQHGSFTQGEWATKTAPIFFKLKEIFPKDRYQKKFFFDIVAILLI